LTTPVYLIRHAKAGNRLRWTEPDDLRPLTQPGHRQAEALVGLLAEQPFSRLLSSPYVRCFQTLEPLAQARDLPLETTDLLAEGAWIDEVLELMLSIAKIGPAALCTHGDVMTGVVEELAAAGIPMRESRKYKKGAAWILDVRDGAFAGASYLPPAVINTPPADPEASAGPLPR
jgi:8-oxo-dGTP diphosphatase